MSGIKVKIKFYKKFPEVCLETWSGISNGKHWSNRRVVPNNCSQEKFDAVIQDWYKANKVELPYTIKTEVGIQPKQVNHTKTAVDAEDLELGVDLEDE